MQRASSNSINTTNFSAARAELAKASAAMDAVEQNINGASSAQQRFNDQVRQSQSVAEGLAGKFKSIVGVIATLTGAQQAIALSDTVAQTTARLDLMNDGLQTTEQLQRLIFESAQRSRGVYQTTADAVGKLGMQAKDAFSSTAEIVAFAEQLNKTFVIAGTSTVGVESAMLQLTQAMAAGKLQGEELNAILDNAQPIVANIAKYMGVPVGQIKQMASEGMITADIIKKAMFAAADETNRKFESMPKTFGQVWTSIKNQALMAFQPVLQQLNGVANSKGFESMVNGIIGGLGILAAVATTVFNEVVYYGGLIVNNWSLIAPVVWGAVAAYAAYNAEMLIAAVRTGMAMAAKIAHAAASAAETMAIIALIAAQEGLNAALYACPLSWILMAVVALIAVFYLAIAAMNKWAGTSLSATGIVVGCFYWLAASVYNGFAYMWNIVAAFVEFFVNVFKHPIYSVQMLFVNLATNVLDSLVAMTQGFDEFATNMANSIVDAINIAIGAWNSFVDVLSRAGIAEKLGISKGNKIEHRASITSTMMMGARNMLQNIGAAPNDYWKASRMNNINMGDAWKSGYKMGEGIGNFNLGALGLPGQGSGIGQSQFNNAANIADTAANTGKMKDSLDITEEDLKYLRDIAEQEVINRFTTAEIKIDMTNHNNINNSTDLDSIVSHLETKLEESMQIAAEGVHK